MGQPEPKPSDLKSPVPGQSDLDAFMAEGGGAPAAANKGQADLDAFFGAQSGSGLVDPNSFPGKIVQGAANAAPTAMELGLGAFGAARGGWSGMAGMGGMGKGLGTGVKQFLEQEVLGKPQRDPDEMLNEIKEAAGRSALELASGETALRVAGKAGALIGKTEAGQALLQKIGEAVKPAADYIGNFAHDLKKGVAGKALDWLSKNMADQTAEASGDAVKEAFGSTITGKFKGFQQAYANLNGIARDIPLSDAQRLQLTSGLRDDARGLPPQLYRMMKGFADKIDSGATAEDVHSVISEVNQQIQAIGARGKTSPALRDKLAALEQFSDRASDFMEKQTYGLARRIDAGQATGQEMEAFERMMVAQKNPTVPAVAENSAKYVKSVAKDYLSQRSAVNADYAKFRGFLEDVGEQVRVDPQGRGPMQFLREVDRIPSEQLVERMFLPKNAAALREMSQTSPEVFNMVKQARVRDVYQRSMEGGTVNLQKLADNFDALPESARSLIISDEDRAMLRSTAEALKNSPIDKLRDNFYTRLTRDFVTMAHAGILAGSKVAKDAAQTNLGRTAGAKAAGAGILSATGQ